MSMFDFWLHKEGQSEEYDPPLLSTRPALTIPYLVLVLFAMIVGFVGNTLIIGAFFVSRRVRIVGNEFVFSLALTDLLITAFADPFLVLGVTAGEAWFAARPGLCELVAAVCLGSCICAFLTLTAVTINRYIYVCHSEYYSSLFSRTSIVALCIACWTLAFLLESANFMGWGDHKFDRKHNSCMWDRTKNLSYTLFLAVGLIGVPITIMIIAYALIFSKIKRIKRRVANVEACAMGSSAAGRPTLSKEWWEVVKSTRTFFLILVAFIITWGPYAIVNAADADDTYPLELHLYVSGWAHMHSAVNCVVYGLTNPHFRLAFRRVLCLPPPPPPPDNSLPAYLRSLSGVVPLGEGFNPPSSPGSTLGAGEGRQKGQADFQEAVAQWTQQGTKRSVICTSAAPRPNVRLAH